MSAIAGPIVKFTVDGREFAVKSDSNSMRSIGGKSNTVDPLGNGSAILVQNDILWEISDVELEIDDLRGDHEFLQDRSNSSRFYAFTAKYSSGVVYQGTGHIIGEMKYDNLKSTMTIGASGPGRLTQQQV